MFCFLAPDWLAFFLFVMNRFDQQAIFSRFIVPRNVDMEAEGLERRYTVRFEVAPGSEFVGKPIVASGIFKLKGCVVVGLQRDNRLYSFKRQEEATTEESSRGEEGSHALGEEEALWARDQLHFHAVVEAIVELRKTDGFTLLNESEILQLGPHRINRSLVEVLFHLFFWRVFCCVVLLLLVVSCCLVCGVVVWRGCLVLSCAVFCCVVFSLFWGLVLHCVVLSCPVLSWLALCGVVLRRVLYGVVLCCAAFCVLVLRAVILLPKHL